MTAVKLRIRDLVEGTYDGKTVHTLFGKVSEARILGTLIDIFSTDDGNYMSLTVDDGTETVRIKAWRQDVERLKKFSKGDFIDVVGKVREYNDEIYLTPELVFRVSPSRWVLRELELMKIFLQSAAHIAVKEEHPAVDRLESPREDRGFGGERQEEVKVEEAGGGFEEEIKKEYEEETEEMGLEEIEEFEILGEDEVVETVLDLLRESKTREALIAQSGLDEIDVELALRELLDEGKIKKDGESYRRANT